MTNLNISIERLIPIAELIEKVNYDQDRIVIFRADLWNSGLIMILKDKFREHKARIELTPSEVTDMIDETKGNYEWLRSKANDTQRSARYSIVRSQLLCLASDLMVEQLQTA